MKCKLPYSGFELISLILFPLTMTHLSCNSYFIFLFQLLVAFYKDSFRLLFPDNEKQWRLKMRSCLWELKSLLLFQENLIKCIICSTNWATKIHWFAEAQNKPIDSLLIFFLNFSWCHIFCYFLLNINIFHYILYLFLGGWSIIIHFYLYFLSSVWLLICADKEWQLKRVVIKK